MSGIINPTLKNVVFDLHEKVTSSFSPLLQSRHDAETSSREFVPNYLAFFCSPVGLDRIGFLSRQGNLLQHCPRRRNRSDRLDPADDALWTVLLHPHHRIDRSDDKTSANNPNLYPLGAELYDSTFFPHPPNSRWQCGTNPAHPGVGSDVAASAP